jgi:hypothetical protein
MARPPKNRIPEKLSEASLHRRRESAQRCHEQFIKGPIPLWWVKRAAKLPGKALVVGMAIWFLRGVTGTVEGIAVTDKLAAGFGVNRKVRYRAITALEKEGLICVDRRKGRSPRVTLVLVADPKSTADA